MNLSRPPRIAVVGSLNADLTLWVPRRPSPDETMHAKGIAWFRGGKGANQAVAAARLGAEVVMVGRVGNDEQGQWLCSGLEADGVDCTAVTSVDAPTGLAVITVDPDDVSIVVAAGANALLGADDVASAAAAIAAADVLLLQGEVSAQSARAAAEIARQNQVSVVFNPAPYNDVAHAVVPLSDVVIVNRTEAQSLRSDLASGVLQLNSDAVLIETRGAAGCVVGAPLTEGSGTQGVVVESPQVTVVDATGAGDAFAGAFAVGLASGATVTSAARLAVHAGAWAVTVAGAQPSLPTRAQLRQISEA